jgi:urease accessory protein
MDPGFHRGDERIGGGGILSQALLTEGIAEIGFGHQDGVTRLTHLYQRDPLRVLFPTPEVGDPLLAAIVTTSGGLVAGDRLDIVVRLAPGAVAHVTASAAEKVYRSIGPTTTVHQSLAVAAGAALEFLPPETILFDGARLRRETVIELGAGAGFLGGDIVVFGRRARGERFTNGFLRQTWKVRREGKLVWGDALHLEDKIAGIIENPACFAGAAAFATLILAPSGRDPRSLLDDARAIMSAGVAPALKAGVTAIGGLVVARWLAADAAALRRAYADLACHLRSEAMGLAPRLPRLWHV